MLPVGWEVGTSSCSPPPVCGSTCVRLSGFVALVFMAGGLVAICYLVARPFRRKETNKKDRRIPYGVAIAVGALAMILISRQAPSARERAFSTLTAAHRS